MLIVQRDRIFREFQSSSKKVRIFLSFGFGILRFATCVCSVGFSLMMSVEVAKKTMASTAVNTTAQLVKSRSLLISMPYPTATPALTTAAAMRTTAAIPVAEPIARRFLPVLGRFSSVNYA